jgi:hypothetical protein
MEAGDWFIVVALLCVLIACVSCVVVAVVRLRRSSEDPVARFTYGWLSALVVPPGLMSCVGLAWALAEPAGRSGLAVAGVVACNLLAQPVALLFCWTGACKLVLGLRGHVGYAWRRVPEEELVGLSASERRGLAWYCVAQGSVGLMMGVAVSVGCAWPLVGATFA